MLSLFGRGVRLCDGVTRREVLRVGALAVGGVTLADVLRGRAQASATASAGVKRDANAKSVIMVWLRGGPSHIDSFASTCRERRV
jgi:hypothetical protein